MGQMGFFDLSNRYTGLDAKNEPLAKIDEVGGKTSVGVWMRCVGADKARKSRAGRKPWDAVVMFKTIILSALYNLSAIRLSIRSGIGCRSCGFWGWVWRTGFPMPRQCGCTAKVDASWGDRDLIRDSTAT